MRIKKATFVCYADPPVAAQANVTKIRGKIVTPANGWLLPEAHKAALKSPIGEYDWDKDKIKPIRGTEIIGSAWNRVGGLIIMGRMPFEYLMDERCTSLCACIRHAVSCKREGVTYLSQVTPMGFIPQRESGGCNPGGFIHFPGAEKFSLSVYKTRVSNVNHEYDQAKLLGFMHAPKLTTKQAMRYFPEHNFGENKFLEKYDMESGLP